MANGVVDQDQQWLVNCLKATLDTNQQLSSFFETCLLHQVLLQKVELVKQVKLTASNKSESPKPRTPDDDSTPTCCFGLCKNPAINDLPLPQNKLLTVEYHVQSGETTQYNSYDDVYFIPIINHPLSSNRYYAIKADGKRQGEAYASSREDDKVTCCFCIPCITDVKPRSFDPNDIYQQFEFSVTKTCFNNNMLLANSVAPDGHPPNFLRRNGWRMNGKTPRNFTLGEAAGVNPVLRAHLADFNFPVTQERSNSVVVGKWYCPFMFVHEGTENEQIRKSVFYEMTLEQRWERICYVENENGYSPKKTVLVDTVVPTEVVRIAGQEAAQAYQGSAEVEVVWFKTGDHLQSHETDEHLGLSKLIIERMMREEEQVGWVKGKDQVRVVKVEEYGGVVGWRSFGCYVLVETFVLQRNDGSVVLTYDFMHTHQLRSKWE